MATTSPGSLPSDTAVGAAAARAAHLLVDDPPYLVEDRAAAALLDQLEDNPVRYHLASPRATVLLQARSSAATRARFAQDVWARVGATQLVVLGAGLDTSAWTWPMTPRCRVIEVDRPGSGAWKQAAAGQAGLTTAAEVAFAGLDLGHDPLAPVLAQHGFDPAAATVVTLLGLTMYLQRDQVVTLLRQIAALGSRVTVVADHIVAPHELDQDAAAYVAGVGSFAAAQGETWASTWSGTDLAATARAAGFGSSRAMDMRQAVPDRLWRRSDGLVPATASGLLQASTG
jgi:methyltransferase (TIGR00027 family)